MEKDLIGLNVSVIWILLIMGRCWYLSKVNEINYIKMMWDVVKSLIKINEINMMWKVCTKLIIYIDWLGFKSVI